MTLRTDPLELLLPDAGPERVEQARRLTTYLRLLADDARGGGARVEVDGSRAAAELERRAAAAGLGALTDLLRLSWNACLPEDSFLGAEPAERDHQVAWSQLEELRRRGVGVPQVPAPGEATLEVARRLLGAAAELGMGDDEVALWSTRLELARDADPERARAGWSALLDGGAAPALVQAALADAAACRLDRGAVAGARALLEEASPEPGGRAATLLSWCRTLEGAPDTSLFVGAAGGLPTPLLELRDACPELLPCLAGAPVAGRKAELGGPTSSGRAALGASVRLVVRLAGDVAELVEQDLASNLARDPREHLRARPAPWTRSADPTHQLLLGGAPVVRRGEEVGVVDPGARALALVPRVEGGAVIGWLHLEWRHLLVPARARLASLEFELPAALTATPAAGTTEDGLDHRAARAAFEGVVDALGTKTRHRRWTGLLPEADGWRVVAGGGGGLPGEEPGGGQALGRAAATGGVACFEDRDGDLALDLRARSGLVAPAKLEGEVVALLALESERRRDFRSQDAARIAAVLEEHALHLRLAQLDAWHRSRFGHGLGFTPGAPVLQRLARAVRLAARATAPVLVRGPRGAGRRVVARWAHFESCARDAALVEVPARDLEALPRISEGAALLVRELEEASGPGLHLLAEHLRRGRRVLLTCAADVDLQRTLGAHAPELARLPVPVPALAERREELPAWIHALVARHAEAEGLEVPRLADDALALLWRQAWPGGFPELETALYRLVLDRAGEAVGGEELLATLAGFGDELRRRLPSRHPRREDVAAALAVTRLDSGRVNKTRAAAYLGWDPDTLVARMGDLGVRG